MKRTSLLLGVAFAQMLAGVCLFPAQAVGTRVFEDIRHTDFIGWGPGPDRFIGNDDGFDDGEEVRVLGTDPLDSRPIPVPEPPEVLLLVAGVAFLSVLYRRRFREQIHRSRATRRTNRINPF